MAFDPFTAVTELVKTGIEKFFPTKMDEADKVKFSNDMTMFVIAQAAQGDSDFRKFIVEYEGSASDYTKIPIIGSLVLLLRGLIRPVFTIGVGYWDWLFFSGTEWGDEKVALLKAINLIVLAFWFGERALKNSGILDVIRAKIG